MGIVTVGMEGDREGARVWGEGQSGAVEASDVPAALGSRGEARDLPTALPPPSCPVPAAQRGLTQTCRRAGTQATRRPVLGCLLRTSGVSSVIIVIYQQLREPQFITLADAQLTGCPHDATRRQMPPRDGALHP